jgi:hypothetical protein
MEGRPVKYWNYFWMGNFLFAGSTFALITLVVLVRGIGELREMVMGLQLEKESTKTCTELDAVAIHPGYSQKD